MLNSAYVYFGLYGEFDPAQLVDHLKITPTSTSRKGSRNPELVIPRQSHWKYGTDEKTAAVIDIYEMADSIVADLEPHHGDIVSAIREFKLDAMLQVVIRFSTDDEISTPAIGFSRKALSFVDLVSATIDIDTYIESEG
ncbi:DUF4279 domain-containing protein [Rhodopirellula europaea]|uniref:DUF4279 domain-containing protein n=1 Tax=Rhodopirellula europaea TaxID=1263866 RepID=UPI003D2AD841